MVSRHTWVRSASSLSVHKYILNIKLAKRTRLAGLPNLSAMKIVVVFAFWRTLLGSLSSVTALPSLRTFISVSAVLTAINHHQHALMIINYVPIIQLNNNDRRQSVRFQSSLAPVASILTRTSHASPSAMTGPSK